ncbi:hypothetical protein C8R45DRAFT_1143019 [Mycena sanguinolenta]|nr:hypothetical protein C8R45DRAFT_1143019 [Mycena sanguinolenta]
MKETVLRAVEGIDPAASLGSRVPFYMPAFTVGACHRVMRHALVPRLFFGYFFPPSPVVTHLTAWGVLPYNGVVGQNGEMVARRPEILPRYRGARDRVAKEDDKLGKRAHTLMILSAHRLVFLMDRCAERSGALQSTLMGRWAPLFRSASLDSSFRSHGSGVSAY